MFSCDHTLVELLLVHHLARPLLEESVLDDGVRVIDVSQLAHTDMQVANRKPIFQVVGGASLLQVCFSRVQGVNVTRCVWCLGRGPSCNFCGEVRCTFAQ